MIDRFTKTSSTSSAMRAICEELDCAVRSETHVLITAEKGSGNALAHLIHQGSARHLGPCVQVDCAALTPVDLETKLFGNAASEGLLQAVYGGTLLLRNAGEMNRSVQDRLLRFLDDGHTSVRVTDGRAKADVRVISTTDVSLHNEMLEGRFRDDLYYRLNVIHIIVPRGERER